jgi:hypothetical protein
MTNNIFSSGFNIRASTRRKIFVSYHHHGDQDYYETFSRNFHDTYEVVTDNSLERKIDSDDADYIKRRISENNITGTSSTIVLVGVDTWGRKYVDWEIKATLDKQHGLIGVQLPTLVADLTGKVIVPSRLYDNIQSGFAVWITWAQITSTPESCMSYIEQGNQRDKKLIVNTRERRLRNA